MNHSILVELIVTEQCKTKQRLEKGSRIQFSKVRFTRL